MEEKSILDEKVYVEAYQNIVNEKNKLDVEDKSAEIQTRIEQLRAVEERNAALYGYNTDREVGDKVTRELVEKYKNEQDEIDKLKEAQGKIQENREKANFLEERRKNVRENIKNLKENEIENRNKQIEQIKANIKKIEDEKIKAENEKVSAWADKLKEVEDKENANPGMAKDEKYKEFLRAKINDARAELDFSSLDAKIEELKNKIPEIQKEIRQVEKEYTSILKNLGRVDRGEEIILKEEQEAQQKPSSEEKPNPEGKSTPESKTNPEGKPSPESKPNPEGKQTPESKPNPEGKSTPESKPSPSNSSSVINPSSREVQIRVGRHPMLLINGSKPIMMDSFNKILKNNKNGKLNQELMEICSDESRFSDEKKEEFTKAIEEGTIDPVILSGLITAINNEEISLDEFGAVLEVIKDKDKDEGSIKLWKNIKTVNMVYDMEDLSKGAIFPWNRKNRDKIANLGMELKEQGIAEVRGEYEPNPFARLMKKVKTKMIGDGSSTRDVGKDTENGEPKTETKTKHEAFEKNIKFKVARTAPKVARTEYNKVEERDNDVEERDDDGLTK